MPKKGLISLEEVMKSLPEHRRTAIEARGADLIAKLELRKARAKAKENTEILAAPE